MQKTNQPKANKNNTKPSPVNQKIVLWAIFIIYIMLMALGLINHEAWRDEAQAWLIVRDTSFTEFLSILRTEGHPPLWYLLIMPLAKAGLPYVSQSVLTMFIMLAGVYILLFRTSLPLIIKLLLPFTYFFLYEYALFARSYCLIAFFVITIISLYPQRFDKPILYSLCIIGLFNTHVLIFTFCGMLTVVYMWELWEQKLYKMKTLLAAIIMAIGGLYLIPYLFLAKMSDEFAKDIANPTERILETFNNGLLISQSMALAIILFIVCIILLYNRPKPLTILIGGLVSILYVLGFKYYSSAYRHEGILFFIILAVIGIAGSYITTYGSELNKNIKGLTSLQWILLVLCVLQVKPAVAAYKQDNERLLSGAHDAAMFIQDNNLEDKILVGHQAWAASALLPYMDKNIEMFYGECERYGTYYIYDSCFIQDKWMMGVESSMDVSYRNFKDRLQDVIFIFNYPVNEKGIRFLDQIYTTPETPIRGDETFYIYKFKEGVK